VTFSGIKPINQLIAIPPEANAGEYPNCVVRNLKEQTQLHRTIYRFTQRRISKSKAKKITIIISSQSILFSFTSA